MKITHMIFVIPFVLGFSRETESTYIQKEIHFKDVAHEIVETGKPEICRICLKFRGDFYVAAFEAELLLLKTSVSAFQTFK